MSYAPSVEFSTVFVSGRWHGPQHTTHFEAALKERMPGHDFIAPEIPSADPGATCKDDARVVYDAIKDRDHVQLGVHSTRIRLLPELFAISDFDPNQLHALLILSSGGYPGLGQFPDIARLPRYSKTFESGRLPSQDGGKTNTYDEAIGEFIFFNRAEDPQFAHEGALNLQPERIDATDDQPLPTLPPQAEMPPTVWARGEYDLVHVKERAARIAMYTHGLLLTEIPTGHSPQQAQPRYLAQFNIEVALWAAAQKTRMARS